MFGLFLRIDSLKFFDNIFFFFAVQCKHENFDPEIKMKIKFLTGYFALHLKNGAYFKEFDYIFRISCIVIRYIINSNINNKHQRYLTVKNL